MEMHGDWYLRSISATLGSIRDAVVKLSESSKVGARQSIWPSIIGSLIGVIVGAVLTFCFESWLRRRDFRYQSRSHALSETSVAGDQYVQWLELAADPAVVTRQLFPVGSHTDENSLRLRLEQWASTDRCLDSLRLKLEQYKGLFGSPDPASIDELGQRHTDIVAGINRFLGVRLNQLALLNVVEWRNLDEPEHPALDTDTKSKIDKQRDTVRKLEKDWQDKFLADVMRT